MKLKAKYQRLTPEHRLYGLKVPVIGLTGGIASGKTTVAEAFKKHGIPIINADHLVKEIYTLPETFSFISKEIPEAIKDGTIHFPTLREKVFLNTGVKTKVENFIYQRLPKAFEAAFLKLTNPEFVIYDVPLLFEKNLERLFDLNVLVYAPRKVQRIRLMKRDGHLEEMAENILNQQMDIEDKKLKAEFIINNSLTEEELAEEINQFLRQIFDN